MIVGVGESFDHYFGTYPNAANTDGTEFQAAPGTPSVNGLTASLLTDNPNEFNPQRLTPSEALTCNQNHGYAALQQAIDLGKMDDFRTVDEGVDVCTGEPIVFGEPGLDMGFYDGNTVTALWNYAQHFALGDESFTTTFGSDTPGMLNLVSGDTSNARAVNPQTGATVS